MLAEHRPHADLDQPMADDPAPRIWNSTTPEGRLSIATFRFLKRALVPPFYVVAIPDSDHGTRSDLQRMRDAAKGQVPYQLDFTCTQGPPPIERKIELKRGKNRLTEGQKQTVAVLIACGAAPIVAWSLKEVHIGLWRAGFKFLPNAETTLSHMEAQLEAWDRQADAIKSGAIVKKRRASKPHVRKAPGLSWLRP